MCCFKLFAKKYPMKYCRHQNCKVAECQKLSHEHYTFFEKISVFFFNNLILQNFLEYWPLIFRDHYCYTLFNIFHILQGNWTLVILSIKSFLRYRFTNERLSLQSILSNGWLQRLRTHQKDLIERITRVQLLCKMWKILKRV